MAFLSSIGNFLRSAVDLVVDTVATIIDFIGDLISELVSAIVSLITKVFETLFSSEWWKALLIILAVVAVIYFAPAIWAALQSIGTYIYGGFLKFATWLGIDTAALTAASFTNFATLLGKMAWAGMGAIVSTIKKVAVESGLVGLISDNLPAIIGGGLAVAAGKDLLKYVPWLLGALAIFFILKNSKEEDEKQGKGNDIILVS